MKKLTPDDPQTHSADVVVDNVERLRELFPEAFTEGNVDFDVLKQLLSGVLEERDEKYGLNWHGKRRARQLALTPSTGTLRPCPDESVDWDTTQNLMIEGDNLEVLKLLQRSYAGKVKLIYIDPPYNTGSDFVYPDRLQDSIQNYLSLTGQLDDEGRALGSNVETSGRFHTAWLNMVYPRLKLARNLLRSDGFLAVSITDKELPQLRFLMNEILGEENFVEAFVWQSIFRPSNMSKRVRRNAEYVVVYARDASREFELVERLQDPQGDASLTQNNNEPRRLEFPARSIQVTLPDGIYPSGEQGEVVLHDDLIVKDGANADAVSLTGRFKWKQEYLDDEIGKGVTLSIKSMAMIPYYRKTYKQTALRPTKLIPRDIVGDVLEAGAEVRALFEEDVFSYPKPTSLLGYLMQVFGVDGNDIVFDFFAGSGTTADAVLARNVEKTSNCRFIVVQLPEPLEEGEPAQSTARSFCLKEGLAPSLAELTKERIRRAGAALHADNPLTSGDVGFRVFKLDQSNLRTWDPSPQDLEDALFDGVEHVREGRTEQDVLYELLLKLGLDLCVPIEARTLAGKLVHSIGAGTLFACLPKRVALNEVEDLALGIAGWREELRTAGETTVVFRDSAFADDVVKTNASAILEQHGIENVRSL